MTEAEQHLVDTAVLMAQELQEFVDDAIETSGDFNSLEGTQDLLKDWETAYAACGFGEDERFAGLRRAIDADLEFRNYQVGHEIEVEHGEFRECIDDGADDDCYDDSTQCHRCDGSGDINICIDDLCHGQDECIHGDGIVICPTCNGSGDAP
jgi:hypothetical protein